MSYHPLRFHVPRATPEPEWDVRARTQDGVVVIGAGGHAKVLISALTASGRSVTAVVDDDDTKWGTDAQGIRVGRIERALGGHGIVNTGATVDHDCVVGDYAHLAPGVHLAGSVRVGEGAFLGIGSVVSPGVRIGRWTTLGAGAVAIRDLADGAVAVGVPARAREGGRPS